MVPSERHSPPPQPLPRLVSEASCRRRPWCHVAHHARGCCGALPGPLPSRDITCLDVHPVGPVLPPLPPRVTCLRTRTTFTYALHCVKRTHCITSHSHTQLHHITLTHTPSTRLQDPRTQARAPSGRAGGRVRRAGTTTGSPPGSRRTMAASCYTAPGRGLHSSTSQLNWSAFYGIGGARRGCVAHVKGVFGVCRIFCVCQPRLKLSSKVDECEPLASGARAAAGAAAAARAPAASPMRRS